MSAKAIAICPLCWHHSYGRRYSAAWQRRASATERAHADGLMVDFDSIEAFEEVFWLTFASQHYLRRHQLLLHDVDEELTSLFNEFISIVLAARAETTPKRYLSKNNNNVLRLKGLASAVPNGLIVVPYRRPIDHARSLLRQHLRFWELQQSDPFTLKYMRWLGHYEFGQDHRPFAFQTRTEEKAASNPEELNYWLQYWVDVYEGILATLPANAVLWDHDAFCAEPADCYERLAAHLGFASNLPKEMLKNVRPNQAAELHDQVPREALARANDLHAKLQHETHLTLG